MCKIAKVTISYCLILINMNILIAFKGHKSHENNGNNCDSFFFKVLMAPE